MAEILYGAPVREQIKKELKQKIENLKKGLGLAILQVGDRADSNIYIKNKIKFGQEIGVSVSNKKLQDDVSESQIQEEIDFLVKDKNTDGIIVQLPLPAYLDTHKIIDLIPRDKDADGLNQNTSFEKDYPLITPATARAVVHMLDFYSVDLANKKVAIVGRSRLAGGAIAKALAVKKAEIFVCGRDTKNIKEICKSSDILISAAGQAGLITEDFVNKNQVVIDVGINKIVDKDNNSKLVGDVAFDQVEPIVKSISPVPGGVGPLTVACLFENLLDLVYNKSKL